jgi:glucokinase
MNGPRKVSEQWLRDILQLLYRRRNLTRCDIAELTGLNGGSVSRALGRLLEYGTILKVGCIQVSGGRKREVFNLNGEAGFFIALDLEGRSIRFALCNLLGDIRYRWEQDLQYGEPLEFRALCEGVGRIVGNLDARQLSRVLAAGVSYPGLLDEEGRVTAVNLGWHKFPLAAELRKAVNLPVFLEHDTRTCVLAERWLGRAQRHENALFVIVERGIGLGILMDGRPVEGWRNKAGEIGHWALDPKAPDQCGCGQRGCLEAIASGPSMVRQYVERAGPHERAANLRAADIFEKARRGDPIAAAVLERAARALGLAVSNAVKLLNPQIVIFGGDIIAGEDLMMPLIKEEIRLRALPDLLHGVEVTVSGLGLDIRLKGAASLAFRGALRESSALQKMCGPVLSSEAQASPLVQTL